MRGNAGTGAGSRLQLLAVAATAVLLSACAPASVPEPSAAGSPSPLSPSPSSSPLSPASAAAPGAAVTVPDPTGWLAAASGSAGRLAVLGDSFAAGEGAGGYRPAVPGSSDSCHRSRHPVAAELFATENIANLACSRATTGHLVSRQHLVVADPEDAATVPAQLDQLRGIDPTLVVLSLGGNDLDFAGLLQACLLDAEPCSDDPLLRAHAAAELDALQPKLTEAYGTVAASVSSPVLVLPYPQLFDEPDAGCGRLSREEQQFARELIADLNTVIRTAVDAAGSAQLRYVSTVEESLAGHGACSAEPYLHTAGVSGLLKAADSASADQELLHPTREGYRAMTRDLVRWAQQ